MELKPKGDRIVVQADPPEEKTSSGIYIPETAKEKPQRGTVVSVGEGRYAQTTGNLIPMTVKVGDHILYGKHIGTEITYNGKEYLLMREPDIFAVV